MVITQYQQEAQNALARLLSFFAQQAWDADEFDRIVNDFPRTFDPNEAESISRILHSQSADDADENEKRGIASDASMTFTTGSVKSYRPSAVNDFSMVLGSGSLPGSLVPGSKGQQDSSGPLHSGPIAGFGVPPGNDLPKFTGPQPGAAARYDDVEPLNL